MEQWPRSCIILLPYVSTLGIASLSKYLYPLPPPPLLSLVFWHSEQNSSGNCFDIQTIRRHISLTTDGLVSCSCRIKTGWTIRCIQETINDLFWVKSSVASFSLVPVTNFTLLSTL